MKDEEYVKMCIKDRETNSRMTNDKDISNWIYLVLGLISLIIIIVLGMPK